jgi:hypothetical protein
MSFLGTAGTLSLIILFIILARLSERLGAVQKMPASYRYYYVALIFLSIAYLSHLLASFTPSSLPTWMTSLWFLFFTHHLPLMIGVTIGLVVTWHYWSWLVTVDK